MNLSVAAILKGASSHCRQSVETKARKAPQKNVKDFPHHNFAIVATIEGTRPPFPTGLAP